MVAIRTETVTDVHHWNENLFSFKTTRQDTFRFSNGHFVMLGLKVDDKPILRAYSLVSANYEEYLEFLSIKVADGKLTSKLQHLQKGDKILISNKPVGTLIIDNLTPSKRLLLLATGTGIAPFISIIKDPDTYDRFEEIVLVHGVRQVNDLAYKEYLTNHLPKDEYIGKNVRDQFTYLPTVSRDEFERQGRITKLISDGDIMLDPKTDRIMLCGSKDMLEDLSKLLDERGFSISPRQGDPGDYVMERSFVEQ